MDSVSEVWRMVPGYPSYEVSDHGRVRSIDRTVERRGPDGVVRGYRMKGKLLKPIENRGYLVVKLGHPDVAFGIHQIVSWAFHGPVPDGMVVDHKDTNKHNNRPDNLEYVTNPENVRRQYSTGLLSNIGETNGRAFLTADDVTAIRRSSEPHTVLAARYNTTVGYIRNIKAGRTWKHVQLEGAA